MSETLETDVAEQDEVEGHADAKAALDELDGADPEAMTVPAEEEDDFAPEPEAIAEPEPATGEQPRGPDGKFAPKAEAAPETPVVAESAPQPIPFKYRGAGTTNEWEGATVDAEGRVVIAPEQVPVLRQKLAAAAQFEADTYPRVQRLEQENAQLKSQQSEKEAQANALFERFMALANDPDEERALTAFFEFRQKAPSIAAEAQTNYWKQQALKGQQPQRTTPTAPSVGAPPSREIAQSAVADTFEAIRVEMDPKYRASVTDADWQQISARIARYAPAFLRQVTPEEAAASGGQFQPGEYALDSEAVKADIEEQVALVAAKAQAAQQAKAAAEAAKFNKGATPKAAPARQPAKAERAMAAAPKKDAREEARAREEYKRSFKKSLMSSPGFPDDEDE